MPDRRDVGSKTGERKFPNVYRPAVERIFERMVMQSGIGDLTDPVGLSRCRIVLVNGGERERERLAEMKYLRKNTHTFRQFFFEIFFVGYLNRK